LQQGQARLDLDSRPRFSFNSCERWSICWRNPAVFALNSDCRDRYSVSSRSARSWLSLMNFGGSSKFFPLTSAFRRAIFADQRVVLDLVLLERGRVARIVDQHQHLVLAHDFADPDLDLGDDPAFEVLDHLDLARRDHLAFAHGRFPDRCERGPHDERDNEGEGAPDEDVRVPRRALQRGRGRLAHELDVFTPIQRRRCFWGFTCPINSFRQRAPSFAQEPARRCGVRLRGLTRALRH
jgi:hypothetical protein